MPTWGAEWMATLTDLRTKRERQAMVSPTLEGLDVQGVEGEWQRWPWGRVQQGAGVKGAVEFICDGQSVRIADMTMIDSLHRIAPATKVQFKSPNSQKPGLVVAGYVAAIVAAGVVMWFAIGWVGSWAAMAAPRSWEKRLGEAGIKELAPEGSTCGGRDVYLAMQSIARRLSERLPAEQGTFDVRVVDQPVLNAMTLPGGYIVIYRGLLRSADTPEELAGVLAHEMQHAVMRHSMKALGRQAALWMLIGLITGGDTAATQIAGSMAGLKMQRSDELDADEGALRMLDDARISSGGFLSFFEKMARSEGGAPWLAGAISTHPETAERISRVRAWRAAHDVPVQPVMDNDSWRRVRASCR
ncbi:MAG: M48 family metallopeptidase [Acidobacteriota bacterium]